MRDTDNEEHPARQTRKSAGGAWLVDSCCGSLFAALRSCQKFRLFSDAGAVDYSRPSYWAKYRQLLRVDSCRSSCGHHSSLLAKCKLLLILRSPQEGHAECIANEDGERQIALIISYNGEETVSCVSIHLTAY